MELSITQSKLYQDQQTGLPTITGWVNALPASVIPMAGGLLALHLTDVDRLLQLYGLEADDLLLREMATRVREHLPMDAVLARGSDDMLFAWLPGKDGEALRHIALDVRDALSATPIAMVGDTARYANVNLATLRVADDMPALETVETLTRRLMHEPEFSTQSPVNDAPLLRSLNCRLEALGLFGQDELIEQILAHINLSALRPETVLLLAPPMAGKRRLLMCVAEMLSGQRIPLARVNCHSNDQSVPCKLLVTLISAFLSGYAPELQRNLLGEQCQTFPWLCGLFPTLSADPAAVPHALPQLHTLVREGLEEVLFALSRGNQLFAIINGLHYADAESMAALANLQQQSGHGLRIIASVHADGYGLPAALHTLQMSYAAIIRIPPVSRETLLAYLEELIPGAAEPDIADYLLKRIGGLSLEIEAALRTWAETGILTCADGHWKISRDKIANQLLETHITDPAQRAKSGMAPLSGANPQETIARLIRQGYEIDHQTKTHVTLCKEGVPPIVVPMQQRD